MQIERNIDRNINRLIERDRNVHRQIEGQKFIQIDNGIDIDGQIEKKRNRNLIIICREIENEEIFLFASIYIHGNVSIVQTFFTKFSWNIVYYNASILFASIFSSSADYASFCAIWNNFALNFLQFCIKILKIYIETAPSNCFLPQM